MAIRFAAALALGLAATGALASADTITTGSLFRLHKPGAAEEPARAVYDPAAGETHIHGRVANDVCISLRLPREWRVGAPADGHLRLEAVASGVQLEIAARSADELRERPEPDLPRRSAAALQREYEATLGKPAQAVLVEPLGEAGAIRFAAIWLDAHFAGSGGFSVETVILEVSPDWLLELTAANVEEGVSDALVARAVSGLEVRAGGDCFH